jgi:hypothetical protein
MPHSTLAAPKTVPPPVGLTVSVFNDAAVAPSVLDAARERATSILQQAGVSLNWMDCGAPGRRPLAAGCSAIAFPAHLSVRLVARAELTPEGTFGQSFLDAAGEGNYANVYVGPLMASSATGIVQTGDLLGFVIVHELGHLLLGQNSHSPSGLMAAVWQPSELREAARGNFCFTSGQAERIRARYLWRARFRIKPCRARTPANNFAPPELFSEKNYRLPCRTPL